MKHKADKTALEALTAQAQLLIALAQAVQALVLKTHKLAETLKVTQAVAHKLAEIPKALKTVAEALNQLNQPSQAKIVAKAQIMEIQTATPQLIQAKIKITVAQIQTAMLKIIKTNKLAQIRKIKPQAKLMITTKTITHKKPQTIIALL